jgi:hypothetical protein
MSIVALIEHCAIENMEAVSGGQDFRRRNELRRIQNFLYEDWKERENLKAPLTSGRMLLSWILQKYKFVKAWGRLNWLLVKIIHCFFFEA